MFVFTISASRGSATRLAFVRGRVADHWGSPDIRVGTITRAPRWVKDRDTLDTGCYCLALRSAGQISSRTLLPPRQRDDTTWLLQNRRTGDARCDEHWDCLFAPGPPSFSNPREPSWEAVLNTHGERHRHLTDSHIRARPPPACAILR